MSFAPDTTSTTYLGLEVPPPCPQTRPPPLPRHRPGLPHIAPTTCSTPRSATPAGGVPWRRRQDRTRPPTAPPPSLFDGATDWAGAYAAHTGKPHHEEDHFVELYSLELLRLMPQHSAGPLPSHERAWKDVKLHRGARGEFRQIYAAALHASRARATADSVRASESACMVARGSRAVSED